MAVDRDLESLARRERFVRWTDVAALDDDGRLRLRVSGDSLPSLLAVSAR